MMKLKQWSCLRILCCICNINSCFSEEVKRKIESLKAYYRCQKKRKRKQVHQDKKKWPFFERIHSFLGVVQYNASTVTSSGSVDGDGHLVVSSHYLFWHPIFKCSPALAMVSFLTVTLSTCLQVTWRSGGSVQSDSIFLLKPPKLLSPFYCKALLASSPQVLLDKIQSDQLLSLPHLQSS